ncbi:MAG: Protein containing a histone methylation motif [Pedosphaera sp.]|nr:Protein containing a histone methylation motif [Pedosphaera sp.]
MTYRKLLRGLRGMNNLGAAHAEWSEDIMNAHKSGKAARKSAAQGSASRRLTAAEKLRRRRVAQLYREINGFGLMAEERRLRGNRSVVYGELAPNGVRKLLRWLRPGKTDVFYDLGSGVGKLVLELGMAAALKKCVGIEVAGSRWSGSQSAAMQAKKEGWIKAKRLEFRKESFLDSDLGDATILYSCSTCFSARLMERLGRKIAGLNRRLIFVTFQMLPRPRRGFEMIEKLSLDTSWRTQVTAYVYEVAGGSGRKRAFEVPIDRLTKFRSPAYSRRVNESKKLST